MADDIKYLYIDEIEGMLKEMGEPKFRAKQIFSWLHAKKAKTFDEMTNLSKPLIEKLGEKFKISNVKILEKLVSSDGTTKYLFKHSLLNFNKKRKHIFAENMVNHNLIFA